ncbi:hypothetical protein D3C78_1216440 [compost metagenome]
MKRLVKKPRLSLTRIGVLRSCATKSMAWARHWSEVALPRITSTSGMRSTGEKKCRPTMFCGRAVPSARLLIGSAEVLLASTASAGMKASALAKTSAFT